MTDTLGRVLILGEAGEECAFISRLVAPGAATCRTSFPPASEDVTWTAVVLVAPSCRSPLAREGALESMHRRMGERTVLVTRFCPDNAQGLPQLPPVRVVWLERVEKELPGILARLAACRPTRQIHALFREHLPACCSGLHPVLDAVFLGESVPSGVPELAHAAGMRARRMRDLWKAAGLPHRPEALVDLGLLGRVLDLRGGEEVLSLNRACYRLGVDLRRMQRAAYRRAGRALGALDTPLLLSAVRRRLDVR